MSKYVKIKDNTYLNTDNIFTFELEYPKDENGDYKVHIFHSNLPEDNETVCFDFEESFEAFVELIVNEDEPFF